MKLGKYVKDKLLIIILFCVMYIMILLLTFAFKVPKEYAISISVILFLFMLTFLMIDFFKKRAFYNNLLLNIERLDKSYLVLETLEKPNFYEGELLYQALYDTHKSMIENVKKNEMQIEEFKDYIEMWIHEVKIPLATLNLMAHNHKDKFSEETIEQLFRIESYVEQVLYYVRSENAEKDYLINEVKLSKAINSVALKNKDALLQNNIDFIVDKIDYTVLTDSKWLEFILNQIINNSIKYKKENASRYIKINAEDKEKETKLYIEDNGIGISYVDLPKVFEKSFTGSNGRIKQESTGMGLFIAKKLCKKLGHSIEIESKENEFTRVIITFYKNEYYNVLQNCNIQ